MTFDPFNASVLNKAIIIKKYIIKTMFFNGSVSLALLKVSVGKTTSHSKIAVILSRH